MEIRLNSHPQRLKAHQSFLLFKRCTKSNYYPHDWFALNLKIYSSAYFPYFVLHSVLLYIVVVSETQI